MGTEAPRVRYREQLIRCGKQNCTRCPHGPYWYAYWNEDGAEAFAATVGSGSTAGRGAEHRQRTIAAGRVDSPAMS